MLAVKTLITLIGTLLILLLLRVLYHDVQVVDVVLRDLLTVNACFLGIALYQFVVKPIGEKAKRHL